MPARIVHRLTPWGKEVKIHLLKKDMDEAALADLLRERGFFTTRTTIIGMMRGYRGKTADAEKKAINEILGICVDASGRPA